MGTLDTAIKSRLTWIAYYPPLDIQQTRKIWKVNLKLLKERNRRLQIETDGILQFARDHYISSSRKYATWNGRQIQNAFKVATALAEWDAYSQGVQSQIDTRVSERDVPARPKLLAAHFQTIANATQVFDSYLQETTGSSEADRAFNAMERADNYNLEEDAYNSAISHTQGRSGSSGHLGPPQPLNPDPAPSAHYPPSQRRRPSNPQGPSRSSFSYSGTSTNNHPAPPRSISVAYPSSTAPSLNSNLRGAQERDHRLPVKGMTATAPTLGRPPPPCSNRTTRKGADSEAPRTTRAGGNSRGRIRTLATTVTIRVVATRTTTGRATGAVRRARARANTRGTMMRTPATRGMGGICCEEFSFRGIV